MHEKFNSFIDQKKFHRVLSLLDSGEVPDDGWADYWRLAARVGLSPATETQALLRECENLLERIPPEILSRVRFLQSDLLLRTGRLLEA